MIKEFSPFYFGIAKGLPELGDPRVEKLPISDEISTPARLHPQGSESRPDPSIRQKPT